MTTTIGTNASYYRRTFSESRVQINNGEPYSTHCGYCNKVGTTKISLRMCTRCNAIAYCGRECQVADYKLHKVRCRRISARHAEIDKEIERLLQLDDTKTTVKDFFDETLAASGGIVDFDDVQSWQSRETMNYFMMRSSLMDSMMHESEDRQKDRGKINEIALETALEHTFDMMTFSDSDPAGYHRGASILMIALGKHQQNYDFLKFWLSDYDFANATATTSAVSSPAFLQMKDEDMFEPLEALNISPNSPIEVLLDMALLKLCIFANVQASQLIAQKFDTSKDVATVIGQFLNAPDKWYNADTDMLLTQARQLLELVHSQNEYLVPMLVDPGLSERLRHPRNHHLLSDGSDILTVAKALMRSYQWWKVNKVAMNFATNFAKTLNVSLPIE